MALKVESESLFSINPRTGDTIGEFVSSNTDDIPSIIKKVQTAYEHWANLSLKTRLELMRKAYRQFYHYQDEIAQIISDETGKPLAEAYSSEILPVLDCFKYYLKYLPKLLKSSRIGSMNPILKLRKGIVRYEPLGIIVVISPWNFPFILAMQHIIPAIFAGNAVIHKPSEHTTLTGLKIREIFDRAYLPKGVLEIVTGLADVGKTLVNAKVDKIIFTGSTEVGKKIYSSAAQNLIPVNMELGGSDPMIVLEDANLERAANGALWGTFCNAGQACLSVERLFVHESIIDHFVEMLVRKAQNIRFHHKKIMEGDISCLANEVQFEKISSIVNDAVKKGAIIKFGGKAREDLGEWYYEPTVLTNVDSSTEILKQEIFGPVLAVTSFLSDDEAVFLANNSEFGLGASVWTQNKKRGLRLARQIQAGSVLVNDLIIQVAQIEAPYTGYKNSGIGISHGPWGVMGVTKPKYINSDRPFVRAILKIISKNLVNNDVWWFKYDEKFVDNFKAFTTFLHGDSVWRKIKSIPATIKAVFRKGYL